ncbi:hypothetical protein AB0J38_37745 [Streptomyces sp. NPDC050095]|uniref:hypothetical protein n=1 Tax=unclassified Streptomyces TaxID=2593676 RepID=UPI003423CFD2
MTSPVLAPTLQSSVDRFARSLIVPSRLQALHPRKRGGAGDAAALAPAIAQGIVSAFEGFAEDFFATVLYLQGQSFAQIVAKMNMNNPDVKAIEDLIRREFPTLGTAIGKDFSVTVFEPPALDGPLRFWDFKELTWAETRAAAQGWMQVRHCLAHGLASGWRSEVWPGPVRKNTPLASSVLRPAKGGKHSLGLHGAISCARIYRSAAQHLADIVAEHLGEKLSWTAVPEFELLADPQE